MKNIIIHLVQFYRRNISAMSYGCCRFYPTCSEYFIESVKEYGVLRGGFKGIKRILKCNVFFKGGYDPLKTKKR